MFRIIFPIFIFTFICLPSVCFSQSENAREQTAKTLKEVEQQIAAEAKQLDSIRVEQASLSVDLKKTQENLKSILEKQSKTTGVLVSLNREMDKLQNVITQLESRSTRTRALLKRRVVAIYMLHHRTSALDYLMQAEGVPDLVRRANYLTIVASRDRNLLERLNAVIQRLERSRNDIVKMQKDKENALVELKGLEIDLANKQAEQETLIEDLKNKETERRKILVALKAHAVELERALAQVMGGADATAKIKLVPRESEKGEGLTDYVGAGLARLRGKLNLPVQGILVRGFGKVQHEKFEDFLFVKGLEFLASIGSNARAVAKGKAIYKGELPGYGNVVILDHGARYYSLYGRLEQFALEVGQVVESGGVVGVLGRPDEKKRNFYFELRIQGKAVDPSGYFATKL